MGLSRRPSIVPAVALGAAASLGVVAVSASALGWRRTKAEKHAAKEPEQTAAQPAPEQPTPAEPGPAGENSRWDSPPPGLTPPAPISNIRRTSAGDVASAERPKLGSP
jgi:hypothetical protein